MSSTTSSASPVAAPRRGPLLAMVGVGLLGVGVLGYAIRGSGLKSKILQAVGLEAVRPTRPPQMPLVRKDEMSPLDCSTGVDPTAPIMLPLSLPNGPVDLATLNDDSVSVYRFDTGQRVPAKVSMKGNAVRVVAPLEANRNYRVHLHPGVKDVKGNGVLQCSLSFFTSSQPPAGVAFEKVMLTEAVGAGGYTAAAGAPGGFTAPAATTGGDVDNDTTNIPMAEGFTCVEFGPDGKLYSATDHGKLVRFTVKPDGTLTDRETFTTLPDAEGGTRLVTGFTFDPASTPDRMVIYITHSEYGFGFKTAVSDFSGRISRISGSKFEKFENLVINLPRSARDHATNQPHFGPDGMLYIPQPSNTATGGPDATWFMREEHGLSATILRLDVNKLTPGQTIDAKTTDAGGPFDINAVGSPLSIYAKGLRMPYDLLWHSNGNMYSAVNGASSGGTTPAGPIAPALKKVTLTEHDWLFKIEPGHYYGHPNPTQGYFVLNGGNPTAGPDFNEVSDYPVGTQPDSGWTSGLYDFGMHVSANGLIEYRSNTFNGALRGKIFVCRFNIDKDLILLGLDEKGNVNYAATGIPGTTQLEQPLDVVEDVRTGNLYVCEYGGLPKPRITLLRAIVKPSGTAEVH